MKSNFTKTFLSIAFIIIGFAAVFVLSDYLEKIRPPLPENIEDEDLAFRGAKLKGFALGFEGLIADWYWMQSLQYIGNKMLNSPKESINLEDLSFLKPRLLYPLLDNATDLDPQFSAAYSYGAVVLPAIDSDQAIKLIEKGLKDNPNDWRLYQHLGFIYWRLKDYEKAAASYEKGSNIEVAPDFMRFMAARMKTQGGSRETARQIYLQMYNGAEDDKIKEAAALRLLELISLDEQDAIRSVLQTYKEKNNRCIASWKQIFNELQALRFKDNQSLKFNQTGVPVDPTGAAYRLENSLDKCDVAIDLANSKIPAR